MGKIPGRDGGVDCGEFGADSCVDASGVWDAPACAKDRGGAGGEAREDCSKGSGGSEGGAVSVCRWRRRYGFEELIDGDLVYAELPGRRRRLPYRDRGAMRGAGRVHSIYCRRSSSARWIIPWRIASTCSRLLVRRRDSAGAVTGGFGAIAGGDGDYSRPGAPAEAAPIGIRSGG